MHHQSASYSTLTPARTIEQQRENITVVVVPNFLKIDMPKFQCYCTSIIVKYMFLWLRALKEPCVNERAITFKKYFSVSFVQQAASKHTLLMVRGRDASAFGAVNFNFLL